MSLLQINTAIPLAEPLLEQVEDPQDRRRVSTTSVSQHGAKCMAWGAVSGFVIQLVSLGAYAAFLVLQYQAAREFEDEEEEDDAATTTAAAFLTGFLPHAIVVTVIVDVLLLYYCMVRCSDTGNKKKTSNHSNHDSSHDDDDDDDDDEIGFSSPPLNQHHTVVLRTVQDILRLPMKMNKTVHVPVHVSPPCQEFSSKNRNNTALHASTPCQGLSLSPQMKHTAVLHASPPCQGFSSSNASPPCQGFSSQNRNNTDSSIRLLPVQDVLRLPIKMNNNTVLHSSPPCQGFSSSS